MGKKAPTKKPTSDKRNVKTPKDTSSNDGTNKPRNLLITDATKPFILTFVGRFNIHHSLTVHQTPAEETWPGGALWDLGLLLSHVLVALSNGGTAHINNNKTCVLPVRCSSLDLHPDTILELGCGVGLTGLAAAVAFRSSLTLLTDLDVVVDQVTQPNVTINSKPGSGGDKRFRNIQTGKIAALPLCWGNTKDEEAVRNILIEHGHKTASSKKRSNKSEQVRLRPGMPDLIIIGDVAYQHKPGAPSHFDVLLSTLLAFADQDTWVVFGTRIRMPASVDLLRMLTEHFDEVIAPPLTADEIDSQFQGVKHNMFIHFLRKKKVTSELVIPNQH
jgi:predicted nicotinamide N-methyase